MNIKEAAKLAVWSYYNNPDVIPEGYTGLRRISTQYGYASNLYSPLIYTLNDKDGNVILVFRGTSNWKNWITDLDFVTHKGAHFGFINLYENIKSLITVKPNIIIGHSLGGALALLAFNEFGGDKCYTFGCPNIGTREYCREFYKDITTYDKIINIENTLDIVTHVPPYFTKPGKVIKLSDFSLDAEKIHSMKNYLEICSTIEE